VRVFRTVPGVGPGLAQRIHDTLGVDTRKSLMTVSALLRQEPETVARTVLQVLLEPAGWFAVWFGLDQLFYGTRELAREHAFYRKMARADVVFSAYSEEEQTRTSATERDQAQ
jgi:hypothetical protein